MRARLEPGVPRRASLAALLGWVVVAACSGGGAAPATTDAGHEAAHAGSQTAEDAPGSGFSFWTCPMHPGIRQGEPGECPLCGMDLVPVTAEEAGGGVVRIDDARRSSFGIATQVLELGPLTRTLRATGRVVAAQDGIEDVTLLVGGQVRDLRVERDGQAVRRGEVLFTIYSPEVVAAQGDLLALSSTAEPLRQAARDRLRRWGMSADQVAGVEASGVPIEDVPVLAPSSGVVEDKDVLAGSFLLPGQLALRVVPLDPIWVEAEIYEDDLGLVGRGAQGVVTLPRDPSRTWSASVDLLVPEVDEHTRTRVARLAVPNPDLALLPGMYADVTFGIDQGEALVVPEDAVVHAGQRKVVFVDQGDDRLAPREVTLGRHGEQGWEVLGGLAAGDRVVTSGNFLVAAESRIRTTARSAEGRDHGQP